jgi:hypothetical protein
MKADVSTRRRFRMFMLAAALCGGVKLLRCNDRALQQRDVDRTSDAPAKKPKISRSPGVPALHESVIVQSVEPQSADDDDSRVVVSTPGCGIEERWLSIPERARIPEEDQEAAREILDGLRQSVQERIPIREPIDDDARRDGGLIMLLREWKTFSLERRTSLLRALRFGEPIADTFVRDVEFIRAANRSAYEAMKLLESSLNSDEFRSLWDNELSWCSVTLKLND